MKDLRLHLRLPQDLLDCLLEGGVGAPELATGELVVGEHRNSGCLGAQRAFCPEVLGGRTLCCLVVYEQALGLHYGKRTAKGVNGTHPQHNHTDIPDRWSTGKTH